MYKIEYFVIGLGSGLLLAALIFLVTSHLDTLNEPDAPPGAIVITRADGVRCVGHVAAPHGFVGLPPRLWICGDDELPWYDSTGTQIPTRPLGEIP